MVKNLAVVQETWVQSLGWEHPLEKGMEPTPVFLPGEFYGQRSLVGYSPWGSKESDMTKGLTLSSFFTFFFMVQLSHPYVTTGKTIALTRRTFVGKVMSLLLNMLSRLIITFLPRSIGLLYRPGSMVQFI